MKIKSAIYLMSLIAIGCNATAADIEAGKSKAATCVGCHGPEGIAFIPTYPNLKGQKSGYLVKQLKDFKAGVRKDPIMISQAKSLSEQDIVNIAAYYESLGNK